MSAPSSSTSHGALDPADPLVYDAVWESNPHTAQRAGWPPDRRPTFVCFFYFPTADPTRAHEVATPGSLDGVPWISMLPVPHSGNHLIEICGSGSSTQSNHPLTTAPNTALRLTETHTTHRMKKPLSFLCDCDWNFSWWYHCSADVGALGVLYQSPHKPPVLDASARISDSEIGGLCKKVQCTPVVEFYIAAYECYGVHECHIMHKYV